MLKNKIDGKFVDEPTPCVYGPPSWYNNDGTFDTNNADVREYLREVNEIKERNRKRKEMHVGLQEMVDKPIECVYGPEPPIEMKVVKPEYVDKPIAKIYGPDPSVFAHTDEDKDMRTGLQRKKRPSYHVSLDCSKRNHEQLHNS